MVHAVEEDGDCHPEFFGPLGQALCPSGGVEERGGGDEPLGGFRPHLCLCSPVLATRVVELEMNQFVLQGAAPLSLCQALSDPDDVAAVSSRVPISWETRTPTHNDIVQPTESLPRVWNDAHGIEH